MDLMDYVRDVDSLLDVGCNVGDLLGRCRTAFPDAKLAGIEINENALETARSRVPSAELRRAGGEKIPFEDGSFQYVSCIEVLEHIPANLRAAVFREIHRVLKPKGSLILTVPHDGWFGWLDTQNIRLRFPKLYRRFVRPGERDTAYEAFGREIEWHHHFTEEEILQLAGSGWKVTTVRHGGLLLYPLSDWLSWPFYRSHMATHPVRQQLGRLGYWDCNIDYGKASVRILMVLQRQD